MAIPTLVEVNSFVSEYMDTIVPFIENRFDIKIDVVPEIITKNFKSNYGLGGYHNGKQMIKIYAYNLLNYQVRHYSEYSRLDKYVNLGSFKTDDWKEWLAAILLHEISHVIQFALPKSNSSLKISETNYKRLGKFEGNHGMFFRRIYKILRDEFLVKPLFVSEETCFIGVEKTEPRKITAPHPMVGKTVFHNKFGYLEIISYHPNRPGYPFLSKQENGELIKFGQKTLSLMEIID